MKIWVITCLMLISGMLWAQDTLPVRTYIFTFDSLKVFTPKDTLAYKAPTTFIFYESGFTMWPWDLKLNLFLVPGSEYDPYPFRCWDDTQQLISDKAFANQGLIYQNVTYPRQIVLFWTKQGLWIGKKDRTAVLFTGLRKK